MPFPDGQLQRDDIADGASTSLDDSGWPPREQLEEVERQQKAFPITITNHTDKMKKATFDKWIEEHRQVADEIRQAAHDLHASVNQTYDGDKPYGFHLDMVAASVYEYGHLVCEEQNDLLPLLFGAYFHDSIEDARLTYNDVTKVALQWMDAQQAKAAAEIVYALTNDKGRTRAERAGERYYQGIRETPYAPFVKLADRRANITYSCKGQGEANSHMREVYKQELPHFIEAIDAHNSDLCFSLPEAMIEDIMHAISS